MLVISCIQAIVDNLTFHHTTLTQNNINSTRLTAPKPPLTTHNSNVSVHLVFLTWRSLAPYGGKRVVSWRQDCHRLRHRTAVCWRASNSWRPAKTLLHPSRYCPSMTCVCFFHTYLRVVCVLVSKHRSGHFTRFGLFTPISVTLAPMLTHLLLETCLPSSSIKLLCGLLGDKLKSRQTII